MASIIILLTVIVANSDVSGQEMRQIPENLIFGTATSSYQVEGAWNEDGKSESIWDRLMHTKPCFTADCKSGDIAADSYHNMDRDVEMLRELGVDHYRFSITWTRILPKGVANEINYAGVRHYNDFITKLLKYNIEPVVTIYHWDLPQVLQDLGGWTNPAISDWYGDYARVVFELFGNRVKKWITINEPLQICYLGYDVALLAPALNTSGVGVYMCNKNVMLAHAKAWHIYNDDYRSTQKGQIGISVAIDNFEPSSPNNTEVVDLYNDFYWATYTYPIFSSQGGFPPKFKERIAAKSASQGLPRSRLPELTPEEIAYIKGTSDFLGINHYSTYIVVAATGPTPIPSFNDDAGAILAYMEEASSFEGDLIKTVPWGLSKILAKVKNDYNNPPVFITENGYAYKTKGLKDEFRVKYIHEYLNALLDAIADGSNVIGYTAWSLMDNLEWSHGYTQRFGLYEVDYDSPARTRTARDSAKYYAEILRTRQISSLLTEPKPGIPSSASIVSSGFPTKENYTLPPSNNMVPNNYMPSNTLISPTADVWRPFTVSFLQKIGNCFKTFYDALNTPKI